MEFFFTEKLLLNIEESLWLNKLHNKNEGKSDG